MAKDFTVIATDLRGYGESSKPSTTPDHAPYSKRATARDQVEVMRQLGFEGFFVAGLDRGGCCAYRMALDHPQYVAKLAVLDILPTSEAFRRADMAFGLGFWQWFFLAQPYPLPERMIGLVPDNFYFRHRRQIGASEKPAYFDYEAFEAYRRAYRDPETIHATCENYRAGACIDHKLDEFDRGKRRILCPALALWGQRADPDKRYDVLAIWRDWAGDAHGRALDCGHYLAEEAPDETYAALRDFFGVQGKGILGRPEQILRPLSATIDLLPFE